LKIAKVKSSSSNSLSSLIDPFTTLRIDDEMVWNELADVTSVMGFGYVAIGIAALAKTTKTRRSANVLFVLVIQCHSLESQDGLSFGHQATWRRRTFGQHKRVFIKYKPNHWVRICHCSSLPQLF
jgi:hypothetical protein